MMTPPAIAMMSRITPRISHNMEYLLSLMATRRRARAVTASAADVIQLTGMPDLWRGAGALHGPPRCAAPACCVPFDRRLWCAHAGAVPAREGGTGWQ